ncbi:MAG: hypothetical protein ACI8VW_002615, partial [bacterium]
YPINAPDVTSIRRITRNFGLHAILVLKQSGVNNDEYYYWYCDGPNRVNHAL